MHIVYMVHAFPAYREKPSGGAGNYVANMARIMYENGHKVSVISEAPDDGIYNWNGIDLYHVNVSRGFKETGKPWPIYKKFLKNVVRSYRYNRIVRQINKKTPVDIVQSANCYALALLPVKKIPYLLRASDDPYIWSAAMKLQYDFVAAMKRKSLDLQTLYWAYKRVDKVIVPSCFLKNVIKEKTKIDADVVESPVLIAENMISEFNEKEFKQGKYFFTYGEMSRRKEIHILADIIDTLLSEYPEMKYVMAGGDVRILCDGQKIWVSEYLKNHIINNRERFIFLGEISDRNRLFSIVKNAVICVLPTRADNLPNTCLEAMALKKIIVSTTSEYGTSVEQLITDGKNGFLAQVDDVKDLHGKIVQAMQLSLEERERMEQAAYDRVKELTPEKVYKKMMNIYTDLIQEKKK